MQKNENRLGYRKTNVRWIPQGWNHSRASDLFKIQGGFAFKSSDATGTGARWLKIANVGFGKVVWNEQSFLPECYLTQQDNFRLEQGDLVVAMTRPLLSGRLKLAQVSKKDAPALLNQRVGRIQPASNVDKGFLFHLLRTDEIAFRLESDLLGTDPPNLSIKTFKRIKVMSPPLPEQKAIAGVLSTWDRAIEKTERLIKAKEKRFAWLLNKLINQGSEKGEWEKVKLGDLLSESRLPHTDIDPRKRLSVKLHLKGIGAREFRGTESEGATTFFKRKAGQFIYGKQNIFRGSLGIIPADLDGYASTQDIPAFDISNAVFPDWLYLYFARPVFYKRLELFASGSGSKRLHPKELFKHIILLPSLDEQKAIAETLNTAQREIDLLKKLADKYKDQKRGLMQKLLTGTWRVKTV